MAGVLEEAKITTRNARANLGEGVHWRSIDADIHLGYRKRKAKKGGRWLVRWYEGDRKYRQETLAVADDVISEGNLDFAAASRRAREVVSLRRREAEIEAAGPPATVRTAVEAYITARDLRETRRAGRPVRSDAARRLERYVIGRASKGGRKQIPPAPLAEVPLYALTEEELITWRTALPRDLKSTTLQRLVNDLKAALNAVYEKQRARLPQTLPLTIKAGLRLASFDDEDDGVPVARDSQILTDAQVGALLAAAREIDADGGWDGDLFRLLVVMAGTGARFSQVVRLRVGDVQRDVGRLMMPASRKGRGSKIGSTPVPVGRDVLDALLPAITGRPGDDLLLERWRSKQIAGSIRWERVSRGAWRTPSELVRPWDQIRQRAGMPSAIPYALRHSSIVRGIRANLPIRLVAALHDTSVAMIERHYGRWIADGLDELAARAVVPLVPTGGEKVVQLTA